MPIPEQSRKERIETIFNYFENKKVSIIDPILFKTRMLYPYLKNSTVKDYALVVMRMLESKRLEVDKDGQI